MQYVGYEESLQCVRVALTQLGPFDGLVGFSQVGLPRPQIECVCDFLVPCEQLEIATKCQS